MDISKQENYAAAIRSKVKTIESQLADNKDAANPIKPDRAIGRLSRMDAMQDQQMRVALQRNRKAELERLRSALTLFDSGEYGICTGCGKDIPDARLEALPDARMCVPCLNEIQK